MPSWLPAASLAVSVTVVVRYEIEQAMFNADARVEDLPGLWNDKMERYLGVRPQSDAEGIPGVVIFVLEGVLDSRLRRFLATLSGVR